MIMAMSIPLPCLGPRPECHAHQATLYLPPHQGPHRAACRRRGSQKAILGVTYAAKKPQITPLMAWRAAVETSHSASELAMNLRALDAAVQWDAVKCAWVSRLP